MHRTRVMTAVAACVFILAGAAGAGAQTKFAGSCKQGKPDPNYTVPVGDRPDHVIVLAKVVCTWSDGELSGVKLTSEEDVVTADVSGSRSHDRGYGVGTAANGDKYFVRFEGTTSYKDNAPAVGTCTWTFTGGTGKLKGLTGKGTCNGTFDATGAAVFDIKGEYQIAAPKAK